MKRRNILIALALCLTLCFSFASAACKKNDDQSSSGEKEYISSDWTEIPDNTNENLKYFGYFHSDGFRSQGSYIKEIAALENSNVVMINSAFSAEVTAEKFAEAKAAGMKIIYSVHNLFEGGKVTVANSASLVSSYVDVLTAATTTVKSYIDDGTLIAFYFDEPAWNGVKEADFRTVTKWLRDNYPAVKVMTTMTVYDIGVAKYPDYPELNPSYNEYCTDVMYDSYAKWNDETRRGYIEKLKTKALQDQYIWGCATGFVDNPEMNDELYAALKGMYTEAIQEPRYMGIIAFSYADGFEGDWGYGLHSFLNNESDYYDKDLKKLYIDVGRKVIGLPPYDHDATIDLTLVEPVDVYEIGETVTLPPAGAVDGKGNEIENLTYEITSPSGEAMPVAEFTAEESGIYKVKVTATLGSKSVTKSCNICVRYPGEISMFDSKAYLSDAGGSDDDLWCWPRQIDTTFSHSGEGSLKVTPHSKDGTWPRIIFERNGYRLWDLSKASSVSMWAYNAGTEAIEGFGLVVIDETMDNANSVVSAVTLQPGEWTKISVSMALVKATKPAVDLTKAIVFYGNTASGYKNRSSFYVDDVTINYGEDDDNPQPEDGVNSFETAADLAIIGGTASDKWCWPTSISTEKAHSGKSSLKVAPHATDGTWPNIVFKASAETETHDLTKLDYISAWIYFDSDTDYNYFAFRLCNMADGAEINKVEKFLNLKAREWTEVRIAKSDIPADSAIDLANAYVKIGNCGSGYADRSNFYIDDFAVVCSDGTEDPEPTDGANSFEAAADLAIIGNNADDVWTWPVSISAEQAHSGKSSLKVTVRQDGGQWPNVVFKASAETEAHDLTKLDYISTWIYFDSDNDYANFAFKLCNMVDGKEKNTVTKSFVLKAREWTEVRIAKSDIPADSALDIANAYVKIGNCGDYLDRSNFYIDDFAVVCSDGTEDPEPIDGANSFETAADLAMIGNNADDVWTWPVSISAEQAHSGKSSLKVTVRQDGGQWPNVVFKASAEAEAHDLTDLDYIVVWIYFDSDNDYANFAFKLCNMVDGKEKNTVTKSFVLKARE